MQPQNTEPIQLAPAPVPASTPTPNVQPVYQTQSSAVQSLIPYKNVPALLAYYFGVFGLIPLLGAPLSFAAIILGFLGLKKHKEHPETKGKGHAIAGVVLGIVEVVLLIAFIILVAVS